MSNQAWEMAGNWLIYATAVTAALFAIGYGFLAPWWRTSTGRNIFSVMTILSLVAVYFGWRVWIGHVPAAFFPIRASLFFVLWIALVHRFILFVKYQLLSRRDRNELARVRKVYRSSADSGDHGGLRGISRSGRRWDDS